MLEFMYLSIPTFLKMTLTGINLNHWTQKEISDAENYYNKGVELIQNEKFETASKQFVKCIEIDSIYIDAYYNLAFCYQKLGNKNMACETWSKLKEMGQKQGEYLYEENCK